MNKPEASGKKENDVPFSSQFPPPYSKHS
jgi:hypothetical protein